MARLLVAKRDPPALPGPTGHPTIVVISLRVMISMLSWANSAIEEERIGSAAVGAIDKSRRAAPSPRVLWFYCGPRPANKCAHLAERHDYFFAQAPLQSRHIPS